MPFQSSSMDYEELIHQALRQGHIISLEIYLNQNPHYINQLLIHNQSKWTPLLAACYYKHEHIVRMLLRRFKPDIEAKGTIVFDIIDSQPEIVEDVSPLWTAAAVDDFDIVRLLIEQGKANINHLTKTHSTTFRVACYNNNLDMVKYLIEHGANPHQMKIGNYTNLMLSTGRRYPLIVKYLVEELQCNIDQQDENGQTALYYAVKSGSYDIVKFLLENGAKNIRDRLRHVTPLMRAALYGEIDLVEAFDGYCSDLEWIEGKELLGATFGGCVARFENRNKTIEYLTDAFRLRLDKNLPKILSNKSIDIFHYHSECVTIEEFNDLISSNSKEDLHIETIRIHQRLLGDLSNDYHHVLRYYGTLLAEKYRYDDCLRWWFYEIDLKQKYNIHLKKEYLRYFIDIFLQMKEQKIVMGNFIRILTIIDKELQLNIENGNFDYHLHTLLYLMTIIARIILSEDKEIKQEITMKDRQELYQFIQFILRRQYRTIKDGLFLLHLSSNSSTIGFSEQITYPCWMTTRLLITCGANVDIFDSNQNTPLHTIVRNSCSVDVLMIINILYDSGAHLDYVNNQRQIPLDLISIFDNEILQHLKEKMAVRQLKCICARLIQNESLGYKEYFSKSLIYFIQKH